MMSIDAKAILERLLKHDDLSEDEAGDIMRLLTDADLPQPMSAALLIGLRSKGETAAEVRGFARAMRELARDTRLPEGMAAADIVGTGGDGSGSLNISTGTALLTAGCGIPVVKHGNRSVSSKSGSADVLEAMGVPMPQDPAAAMHCLSACGFTFLFAPFFHPAMKAIAPVRAAMGVRTVFNILGPLTNPARPPFNLIGAFDLPTARLMAETLMGMDMERSFVVHGEPGWDEATPVGPFTLFDVRPSEMREERRDPQDYGIPRCSPDDLIGGDAAVNAAALEGVLSGADAGPHRDTLVLGAGLVLELTGMVDSLDEGIERALEALASGDVASVLQKLRDFKSSS